MLVVVLIHNRYIITKLFVPFLCFATPIFMPLTMAMVGPSQKCSKRGTILKDALESNFTIEFAVMTIANTMPVILKRHITVHCSSSHLRHNYDQIDVPSPCSTASKA